MYISDHRRLKAPQVISDWGYPNCGEGWFDLHNQGFANDYCRWVGDCGCRGSCSWWSCALAEARGGTANEYSGPGIYKEHGYPGPFAKGEPVPGECVDVTVGSSNSNPKTVIVDQMYICPCTVTNANWDSIAADWAQYSGDRFSTSRTNDQLTVTRTDLDAGWGMNLKFQCCASGSSGSRSVYRVSNNGVTGWNPEISEILVYADHVCTKPIQATFVEESGHIIPENTNGFGDGSAAFDGDETTFWRPQW